MDLLQKITATLSDAVVGLSHLKDDFFIIGSSALVISGIRPDTGVDIDILTSGSDAEALKNFWKNKLKAQISLKDKQLFYSNFECYSFPLMDIEVMGDLKVNLNGSHHLVTISEYNHREINGMLFKIPTIAEQIILLKMFSRPKDLAKIQMIKDQLML